MKTLSVICLVILVWIAGLLWVLLSGMNELSEQLADCQDNTSSGSSLGLLEMIIIGVPLLLLTGLSGYLWQVKKDNSGKS